MEDVEQLQRLRLRLHRLEPSRPIRDLRGALGFIRERRIVLSTGSSSLAMLAEAIAGRTLVGSWMAHRDVAYRIYELLGKVHKHRSVIAAPLVLGKETLVHAPLCPAVERIASDLDRRRAVRNTLPPMASELLEAVERRDEVRMDRWYARTKQGRDARLRLERELLVVSRGLHTESGYHTAIVMPWARSKFSIRCRTEARRWTFTRAIDELIIAAVRSAVVAPEREVRRWFPFGRGRTETLISAGKLTRLVAGSVSWLTCDQ